MSGAFRIAVAFLALLPMLLAQKPNKLRKMEQDFQEQKDALHQARAMAKLLPKEIEMASKEVRQGHAADAISRLERYRDCVVKVHQDLLATGQNPVKNSEGYRQLQIALRVSLRRLRDLIFDVPLQSQQRFELVWQDLGQVNNQLLQELFPPPQQKKEKGKAKS